MNPQTLSESQPAPGAETAPSADLSPRRPREADHLPTLDALRGFAALAVCWFHLTTAQFYETFGVYGFTGKYGYLGVQIFFVISGFVIPFSMLRSEYRVGAFFKFMLKRITRLDPPYLVSIALVLSGYYFSSLRPGHPPYRVDWTQVAAHLGYVNAFVHLPWLQMSYWSLAVEFQYYIFVGLCFPFLALRKRWAPAVIVVLLGAASLLAGKNDQLLPHFLPLFALGILAFRSRCLKDPLFVTLGALVAAAVLAVYVDGWLQACVAAATCALILWVNIRGRIFTFLGNISYSLYLMHVFVGDIVYGLAIRWLHITPAVRYSMPLVALVGALVGAYLMNVFVEFPSRQLAARLSYKPKVKRKPNGLETHAV